MASCFRQGSNLEADVWELVNAQCSGHSPEEASLLWPQVIFAQAAGLFRPHRFVPGFWIH